MKHILKCPKCMEYTMMETCRRCKVKTVNIHPPKYSSKDTYARYRRKAKESKLKEKGLI